MYTNNLRPYLTKSGGGVGDVLSSGLIWPEISVRPDLVWTGLLMVLFISRGSFSDSVKFRVVESELADSWVIRLMSEGGQISDQGS